MGRPVVHWELMSKDPARVADFYEKVFDWKIQHIPEINYRFVEDRRPGRHQRRHHPATAARAVARQHDPLY